MLAAQQAIYNIFCFALWVIPLPNMHALIRGPAHWNLADRVAKREACSHKQVIIGPVDCNHCSCNHTLCFKASAKIQ